MKNITRTISDEDFEMITEHFRLLWVNHMIIAMSSRENTVDEILVFILRYTKWDNRHFTAIKDDAVTIQKILRENEIFRPIL